MRCAIYRKYVGYFAVILTKLYWRYTIHEMDIEKLINLVYEKNPLWDMTDKAYHMRDVQRKLWQEVAVEIGAKVDEVKNKWRGLRDTFRKEFNKPKKRKSGDSAESVVLSKWPYYKMMLFLSNVVERRKLHGNVSPQKNINNSDSETEIDPPLEDENQSIKSTIREWPQQDSNIDTQQSSQLGTQVTSSILNAPSKPSGYKKTPKNREKYVNKNGSIEDKFLEIEKSKLEILSHSKNRENDSEYQFLMSLLPFLKSVPRNRQMLVRHKLQEVFLQEEQVVSARHASSSYNCNETVISTPLPSPISNYTHSDSSNNYSTSFLTNMESAVASQYSSEGKDTVPMQHLPSIRNYVSNFSE